MHIDIVDNIPLNDTDGDLIITEQYHCVRDWFIGYNSSWKPIPFANEHCLFIDIDREIDNPKRFLIESHKEITLLLHKLRINSDSLIMAIMQSSNNHYHIVSPNNYTWPECQIIWHTLITQNSDYNLRYWVVQNTMRGYATLRLSKKEDNEVKGLYLVHGIHNEDKPLVSKPIWEIMRLFFRNNRNLIDHLDKLKKKVRFADTDQRLQPYGGH